MTRNVQLKLAVLLLGWVIAFYPILPAMVTAWFSHSDNSYALLVSLISVYFIWEKREEMSQVAVRGSNVGWGVLILSLLIYLVSYTGGIAFFARLMLVTSLIGLVWSVLGTPMIRLLAFPLGFLFFMVPVPDTLLGMVSFPLQMLATKISADLISFCTIPVYREGNMLYFLQTQLEVAEACSGIRSMMALIMLSVIFAYLSSCKKWRRCILALSAIPIALIANILRISGTGVLAHFFGDKVARGFLHEFSGMAVFAFGLFILYVEFRLFTRSIRKSSP